MSLILPPKKDVALALLERASVFIHLDPRQEGVVVPTWLKKQPQLVLQVGLNMAVQIPDLEVRDDAVSCTLSFSRRPQHCMVPWSSIYALVGEDGRGMIWPEDIPSEVAAQADTRASLRALDTHAADPRPPSESTDSMLAERANTPPSSSPPGRLMALEGSGSGVPPSSRPSSSSRGRSNSERPYLRLVR